MKKTPVSTQRLLAVLTECMILLCAGCTRENPPADKAQEEKNSRLDTTVSDIPRLPARDRQLPGRSDAAAENRVTTATAIASGATTATTAGMVVRKPRSIPVRTVNLAEKITSESLIRKGFEETKAGGGTYYYKRTLLQKDLKSVLGIGLDEMTMVLNGPAFGPENYICYSDDWCITARVESSGHDPTTTSYFIIPHDDREVSLSLRTNVFTKR